MSSGPWGRGKEQYYLPQNYSTKLRVVKTSEPINFFANQLTEDYLDFNPEKESKFSSRYFDTPLSSQRKYRIKMMENKEQISKALNSDKGQIRAFSYISQLYKKPIERQIVIKKHKEDHNQQFSNLLVYKSIKLKPKQKTRLSKTSESRCRCHHNSQSVDMSVIKKARLTPPSPRIPSKIPAYQSGRPKKSFPVARGESWMLDSWDEQGKIENNSYLQ